MAKSAHQNETKSKKGEESSGTKVTTDPEEIRRWVESHGGHPAHVKGTGGDDDPGLLRIDFPGYSGEGKLEPLEWDEFFEKFEESGLAFLYQEKTKDGKPSRFNKFVSRETVEERTEKSGSRSQHAR